MRYQSYKSAVADAVAKTDGRLVIVVCDDRCGHCKAQKAAIEALTDAGIWTPVTVAQMGKAAAGGLGMEAAAGALDLSGKRTRWAWPLFGTFKVNAKGKPVKVGRGTVWCPDAVTQTAFADWVNARF